MKMHMATSVLLFVLVPVIHAQDAVTKTQPQDAPEIIAKKDLEADLGARKKNLITESEDLESIAKSLGGFDADNALAIDRSAEVGVANLDATYWFVGIYNRMQCDKDKNLAKVVLQNRLAFYAHVLDLAVDQTNGYLALTRIPAVALQGQRIRDELRSAKVKLDEISASLN